MDMAIACCLCSLKSINVDQLYRVDMRQPITQSITIHMYIEKRIMVSALGWPRSIDVTVCWVVGG